MELTKDFKDIYPFKSNYLNIDDYNMHYVDEGDGPVLILVHGNPTWSFHFRELIKSLRSSYRVIALDHIGCGLSDKPQDYAYTLQRRIDDLTKLIKFLDIEKYSLLVHDWGGAIGFGHAVEHNENIEKIIILNTAAFRSTSIPWTINLCKNKLFGPFIVKYFNAFCYPATFMTTVKKLPKNVKKAYLMPYSNPKNRVAVSEFVQDIPLDKSHPSFSTLERIESKLVELKQEKLILWGAKDFCFHDEFFVRWKSVQWLLLSCQ